jgi:hypothetical protein
MRSIELAGKVHCQKGPRSMDRCLGTADSAKGSLRSQRGSGLGGATGLIKRCLQYVNSRGKIAIVLLRQIRIEFLEQDLSASQHLSGKSY